MDTTTAILRIAEIAAQNGGVLPVELSRSIEGHVQKTSVAPGFIETAIKDTVNIALYGHRTQQ